MKFQLLLFRFFPKSLTEFKTSLISSRSPEQSGLEGISNSINLTSTSSKKLAPSKVHLQRIFLPYKDGKPGEVNTCTSFVAFKAKVLPQGASYSKNYDQ